MRSNAEAATVRLRRSGLLPNGGMA
jgi:hypothetical protein